jgi:hypothetical protein
MGSGMFLDLGSELYVNYMYDVSVLFLGGLKGKFTRYLECMGSSLSASSLDIMASCPTHCCKWLSHTFHQGNVLLPVLHDLTCLALWIDSRSGRVS